MSTYNMLSLTVNGKPICIPLIPGETLAELLRERLNLTGTKIGCNEDECGVCTVLVDGKPILSCSYPAARAYGKDVLTIEGLSSISQDGEVILHPLQDAFIQYGAVQCGYCIPGQIMTAYSLLEQTPDPDISDIRTSLKDTLCRCGGYLAIEKAIQAAAKSMLSGEAIPEPDVPISSDAKRIIGQVCKRPDAVEKVTGQAKFTDDLKFPDMLYAAVKRAGIPHGILNNLNIAKALQLDGVEAVLTAQDLTAERNHGLVINDWPILVGLGERVRYIGDAVAIVAASSPEIAIQAVELISAVFEIEDVISDPVTANQANVQKIHESGNLLKHIKVRKGDIGKGFEISDLVIERVFQTSTLDHAFLEPECTICRLTPEQQMEVYVGSQIPYADRSQVAVALGWPEERVRVIGQLMGGGFGGKEDIAGQIHAALLTQITGKPVKLLFDRQDSLLVHPKRHATQIKVKIGAQMNGQIIAVETELYGDTGAYASLGEKVMTRATTHSSGPYEVEHVKADCYAMYTNNPPSGAFRGFGVTQSAFAVESMIDILAEELKMDPIQLRRKNALKVGSTTNTGQKLTNSVGLLKCIDLVGKKIQELSDGNPFKPEQVENENHIKKAWGIAAAYKNTGLGGGAPDKAGAEVEILANGKIEVRTSSAELGQGLVTVLQMITAEEFNTSVDQVSVLVMDTDLTPDGGPTTASRQTYVTGNAARLASQSLVQTIQANLAELYDLSPTEIQFTEGQLKIGQRLLILKDALELLQENGVSTKAKYEYWAPKTDPLGKGGDMHFAYSFAAQAAEVAVNTRTGEVEVLRLVSATDVGKVLNPLGLQGQIEGGIMMGIGNAITEEFIIEDGYVFTDHLSRYRIPNITYTPEIISFIVEEATNDGPYGAKGVGEIVSIPTTPAITNAIYNAVGVRIVRTPIDQEEIYLAIHNINTKFEK
ncbi:MAG: molybdopterin-dependent oxidoreductase [Anaerolineaceae bacterium]|nr:molybdopterin-dependent oxidoreductase [Anaerolineaceae bacterium]